MSPSHHANIRGLSRKAAPNVSEQCVNGGIGTVLIRAAEQRIRACGLHRAELGVEGSNPGARSLYERLGYAAYGSQPDSWAQEAAYGTVTRYETMLTLMRKQLP